MLQLYKTNTNHITMLIQKHIEQHNIVFYITVNGILVLILLFKSKDFENLSVWKFYLMHAFAAKDIKTNMKSV